MNFSSTDKLFNTDPFSFSEESRNIFFESFLENAQHHYDHQPFIKFVWDKEKIRPSDLKSERDLERAPFVMVHLFKEHELMTGKHSDIVLRLTSSGTSGQKSQQFLNEYSLQNVKKLAYKIHEYLGITSKKKYNYLCFTYDPKVANDLGTAFTDELLTSFTDKNEVFYAIEWNHEKNDFELNEDKVVQKLYEFEKSQFPLRILGFPAFLYKIIKKYNLKIRLPEDSWLQTGGGWKGASDEQIEKHEFRKFIETHLGIKESNQRDMFGMVEHGIPYVDCEEGHLHIPNYARVFIRDPKTMKFLSHGEVGLIQFMCTYNTSYPAFNLLTTDYGMVKECSCKRGGPILEIIGRAGVTKHKGCALKALELIKDK